MKRYSAILVFIAAVSASPIPAAESGADVAGCIETPNEVCVIQLLHEAAETEKAVGLRASVYAFTAAAYEVAGDETAMKDYFGRAMAAAESEQNLERRDEILSEIADWGPGGNNTAGTLAAVQSMQDESKRHQGLERYIRLLVLRKKPEIAAEIADDLKEPASRARALGLIARAQADAGDIDGAMQSYAKLLEAYAQSSDAIDRLPDLVPSPTFTLGAIAAAQVRAGELEAAFETERMPHERHISTSVRARIAGAQAEIGDIEGAFATIDSIGVSDDRPVSRQGNHGRDRDLALSSVIAALLEQRNLSRALDTVDLIKDDFEYEDAITRIAELQAEAGDPEAVLKTLRTKSREIEPNDRRRIIIAQAFARAGRTEKANSYFDALVAKARRQKNTSFIAFDLSKIALAKHHAGDPQGASDLFTAALAYSREGSDKRRRGNDAVQFARMQADISQLKGAMATAMTIERPGLRARALVYILAALRKS